MFCLRSWIPILFFLTNASPIYLVLFISATYILNRPCVYCSLLLCILVLSLFDFNSNWFEPRYTTAGSSPSLAVPSSAEGSLALGTTGAAVLQVVSDVVGDAVRNLGRNIAGGSRLGASAAAAVTSEGAAGVAGLWVRGLLRREWRINCLDVVLRL